MTRVANASSDSPIRPKRKQTGGKRAHHVGSFYQRSDGLWIGSLPLGARPAGKPDRRKMAARSRAEMKDKLDGLWKQALEGSLPEPSTWQPADSSTWR
ncbi:MAG TPA: hypothetical protein VFC51_14285 [Chloroflexota bacterium]|nr:hypothetical protein [Chloroflexota bacterium]